DQVQSTCLVEWEYPHWHCTTCGYSPTNRSPYERHPKEELPQRLGAAGTSVQGTGWLAVRQMQDQTRSETDLQANRSRVYRLPACSACQPRSRQPDTRAYLLVSHLPRQIRLSRSHEAATSQP